jgi:hypothetical protein
LTVPLPGLAHRVSASARPFYAAAVAGAFEEQKSQSGAPAGKTRLVSCRTRDIPEAHSPGHASVAPAPARLDGPPFHIPRDQALALEQVVGKLACT